MPEAMTKQILVRHNKTGEIMFSIDAKEYEPDDKFGFNFDNAPTHYAVFTVQRIEDKVIFVNNPVLVIKEK